MDTAAFGFLIFLILYIAIIRRMERRRKERAHNGRRP